MDVEGEDERRKPDYTPLVVQMTFRQGARKSDSRIMTTETTQATESWREGRYESKEQHKDPIQHW